MGSPGGLDRSKWRSDAWDRDRGPCPFCGVPRFEYCRDGDRIRERCHEARSAAARNTPAISPAGAGRCVA